MYSNSKGITYLFEVSTDWFVCYVSCEVSHAILYYLNKFNYIKDIY